MRIPLLQISAHRKIKETNANGDSHIFGVNYPMRLARILYNQSGSGISKMAATKPEVPVSKLLDKMPSKCQRYQRNKCLRGPASLDCHVFNIQLSNVTIEFKNHWKWHGYLLY